MSNTQAFTELCQVSRQGVCILDLQQVLETAQQLNLHSLAQIVRADIEAKQTTTGQYYQLVAMLYQ